MCNTNSLTHICCNEQCVIREKKVVNNVTFFSLITRDYNFFI